MEHIVCFGYNQKRHYKNKCLLAKKGVKKKVIPKFCRLFHNSVNPSDKRKVVKSKDHIVCFAYGEKGHYHTKCPRREAVKEEKPRGAMPMIRKSKEYIVCFSCNEKEHYHNQCQMGGLTGQRNGVSNLGGLKGQRNGVSNQEGVLKVKGKVSPNLNSNSNFNLACIGIIHIFICP